jgi:defect in organelle trafficking protein DotD
MKKRSLLIVCYLSVSLSALTLSGCSSSSGGEDIDPVYQENLLSHIDTSQSQAVIREANTRLIKAADSVDQSLQHLFELEAAAHPHLKLPAALDAKKAGLTLKTTINWTGPVLPLLKKIATSAKYKISVLGKEPAIPVIVSLNKRNTPMAEVLRNIQFQVERYADVVINPKTRVIELRYTPMGTTITHKM